MDRFGVTEGQFIWLRLVENDLKVDPNYPIANVLEVQILS